MMKRACKKNVRWKYTQKEMAGGPSKRASGLYRDDEK